MFASVTELHLQSNGTLATLSLINPLNAELNPICYLLVLLGVLHISKIRVKLLRYAAEAHGVYLGLKSVCRTISLFYIYTIYMVFCAKTGVWLPQFASLS
jgi:hypothetical protein